MNRQGIGDGGELLAATKANGWLNSGAAGMVGNQHTGKLVRSSVTTAPKLADAGISKDLSSRAQKLAAVPETELDAEPATTRERGCEDGARVSAWQWRKSDTSAMCGSDDGLMSDSDRKPA